MYVVRCALCAVRCALGVGLRVTSSVKAVRWPNPMSGHVGKRSEESHVFRRTTGPLNPTPRAWRDGGMEGLGLGVDLGRQGLGRSLPGDWAGLPSRCIKCCYQPHPFSCSLVHLLCIQAPTLHRRSRRGDVTRDRACSRSTVLTVSGSREHVTGWAVLWTGGIPCPWPTFPPLLLAAAAHIACYFLITPGLTVRHALVLEAHFVGTRGQSDLYRQECAPCRQLFFLLSQFISI